MDAGFVIRGSIVVLVAIVMPLPFRQMFGRSDAILVYAGALVTALVALVAHTLTRQANRRLNAEHAEKYKQLKLEAAMRAGASFAAASSADDTPVDPATAASSCARRTHRSSPARR